MKPRLRPLAVLTLASFALILLVSVRCLSADEAPLRIAVFKADATPAIGSPVAYVPARSITAAHLAMSA